MILKRALDRAKLEPLLRTLVQVFTIALVKCFQFQRRGDITRIDRVPQRGEERRLAGLREPDAEQKLLNVDLLTHQTTFCARQTGRRPFGRTEPRAGASHSRSGCVSASKSVTGLRAPCLP